MFDKDYLLEKITEENVLNIMKQFNVTPHGQIKENEIWFKTICHGGSSHKLCYFRDTKLFRCYTNCGHMNIFTLIEKVTGCLFPEALNLVAKEIGLNSRIGFNVNINNGNKQELIEINKYIELRKKKPKELLHLPAIENVQILNYFENDVFYRGWIDEGISIPTMQYFGIRWYELEKHIIIPHLNILGEIIGIRRRSLQEKDKENKYMPEILEGIMYTHSLNVNFYGLYEHLEAIKRFKKVVIVESEKSVLLAHDYYGKDAFVIATCGFNISNWHRDILLSLGVDEVMIAFDKDFDVLDFEECEEDNLEYKEFQQYVKRIYSLADKLTSLFRTYVIWDRFGKLGKKDSPFDKGKEVLEFLMKNKVEITTDREDKNN